MFGGHVDVGVWKVTQTYTPGYNVFLFDGRNTGVGVGLTMLSWETGLARESSTQEVTMHTSGLWDKP